MDNVVKCALCVVVGFLLGFGGSYALQPEPKVEIRAKLTPPFVEVIVNGKVYDANHLKVVPVPAPKKGWWGDALPIAMNCQCGEDCNCQKNVPILLTGLQVEDNRNKPGGNDQASLFSGIVKELLAWIQPRYDDAAKALADRERALAENAKWSAGVMIVALLATVFPLWWIAFSQSKLAGK